MSKKKTGKSGGIILTGKDHRKVSKDSAPRTGKTNAIQIVGTGELYEFYRFDHFKRLVFLAAYNRHKFSLADCKRMFEEQYGDIENPEYKTLRNDKTI